MHPQHLVSILVSLVFAASSAQAQSGADADAAVLRAVRADDGPALREALRAGGSPDARTEQDESVLYLAVLLDHPEAAAILLDAGAKGLNELHGRSRLTLLQYAAYDGSPTLTRLLLEKGAEVQAQAEDGKDALAGAVASGSPEVLTLLLDAGADPNRRVDHGMTAVARAAAHGEAEIMKVLLARRGDPELRDPDGNTPLIFAASQCRVEVVRLLLDRKVRLWHINGRSRAALGEALLSSRESPGQCNPIVALLRAAGAKAGDPMRPVDQELLTAAARGDLEGVKAALARGADVDARGKKVPGKPWFPDPLVAAVRSPQVFRYLLERGSDPRKSYDGGVGLLARAAVDGVPETIEVLVSFDPDSLRARWNGKTALSLAIESSKPSTANVETLLRLGADPAASAPGDWTMLERAQRRDLTKIVELLEAAISAREKSPEPAPAAP